MISSTADDGRSDHLVSEETNRGDALDKGMIQGQDSIMLLRTTYFNTYNLKLMDCLFLELSI